jgi:hypothetical protein
LRQIAQEWVNLICLQIKEGEPSPGVLPIKVKENNASVSKKKEEK